MATRDPITCHVLDTTTGKPAANMTVQLRCLAIPDVFFLAKTNTDGRITNWNNTQGSRGHAGAFVDSHNGVTSTLMFMIREFAASTAEENCPAGSSLWKLEFNTGAYYGVDKVFFPLVELNFLVNEGQHFHVPLLLGPYSFTTYRGS